jgi:hypothetical protein
MHMYDNFSEYDNKNGPILYLPFFLKLATEKSSASVSDLQLLLYLSVLSFPSSALTNHVSSTHSKHQASRAHIQANKVD